MKRITNIKQLKPGNKIFTVNSDGLLEILEFREIHPHSDDYSLFLNEDNDGMHKFFNKTLDELDFRNRYNVNVIIIVSKDDEVNQMPQANDVIQPHDKITVVGQLKDIRKLNDIVS